MRDQLWNGTAVIGLADVEDPELRERLRTIGFVDVYTKPISADELYLAVRSVLDRKRLTEATGLIGQSDAISEVLLKIEQIAPVSSTVIIEGESGTGKELVAQAIHRLSPRRGKPFIAVNAGALPETLIESELFGHEKGAFTGARRAAHRTVRAGRHGDAVSRRDRGDSAIDAGEAAAGAGGEKAHARRRHDADPDRRESGGGDESSAARECGGGEVPRRSLLPAQRPQHLSAAAAERREDIPLLVRRFIKEFSSQHDRPFHGISAEAMQILMSYPWPGNVRELRNLVESMVVLAPGGRSGPRTSRARSEREERRAFYRCTSVRWCAAPLARRGASWSFW